LDALLLLILAEGRGSKLARDLPGTGSKTLYLDKVVSVKTCFILLNKHTPPCVSLPICNLAVTLALSSPLQDCAPLAALGFIKIARPTCL
uniref:hypothetical protein n=1 Tax=Pseudomonas syringae group genomosp. 3 TaxID=251701 RepID=UPI001C80BB39